MKSYAVGIDFGTTKSHLAYINRQVQEAGNPPIISRYDPESKLVPETRNFPYYNNERFIPVPTVMAINRITQNPVYVGFGAYNYGEESNNQALVKDLKDRSGLSDPHRNVCIDGKEYPIEGLIGRFLWALKHYSSLEDNDDQLGITITVPAQSNSLQRLTLQIAARVANFSGDIEIVEEPVAAFLYHRHMNWGSFHTEESALALVVDFGGGTCDVALIRYDNQKLPIVIGRAMAKLGGNRIDEELIKTLWMGTKSKAGFQLSADDFDQLEESDKVLLMAYARRVKEALSSNEPSRSIKLHGVGALKPGTNSPLINQKDFQNFLLKKVFENIQYSDDPEPHSLSLKAHIKNLVIGAIKSAKLSSSTPRMIKKLILAGGSSNLPFIQMWVEDALRESEDIGLPSSNGAGSLDVIDSDPDICVASGAAIHQLYIHHKKGVWHGAVESTLPWNISLFHNFNRNGKEVEVKLGEQGDLLPIDAMGFAGKSKVIFPARRSDIGETYYTIRQGRNNNPVPQGFSDVKPLDKPYGSNNSALAWLNGILINFYIDKYGILRVIKLRSRSLLSLADRSKDAEIARPFIGENENFVMTLRRLQSLYEQQREIAEMHKLFIPRK